MMTSRKQPGVAFRATAAVLAVLANPISFGPACWLTHRGYVNSATSGRLYRPILKSKSKLV